MLQSIRWLIPAMKDPTWSDAAVALLIVVATFIHCATIHLNTALCSSNNII